MAGSFDSRCPTILRRGGVADQRPDAHRPVPDRAAQRAVHAGVVSGTVPSSSTWKPPVTVMIAMPAALLGPFLHAICVPSGDHDGSCWLPGRCRICRFLPSREMVAILALPPKGLS